MLRAPELFWPETADGDPLEGMILIALPQITTQFSSLKQQMCIIPVSLGQVCESSFTMASSAQEPPWVADMLVMGLQSF